MGDYGFGAAGAAAGVSQGLDEIFAQRLKSAALGITQQDNLARQAIDTKKLAQADSLARLSAQDRSAQIAAMIKHQQAEDAQISFNTHEKALNDRPVDSFIPQAEGEGNIAAGLGGRQTPVSGALPSMQTSGLMPLAPDTAPDGPAPQQLRALSPIGPQEEPGSGPALPSASLRTASLPGMAGGFRRIATAKEVDDQAKAKQALIDKKDAASSAESQKAADQRQLATLVAGLRPEKSGPQQHYTQTPEIDPATGKQTGRFFSFDTNTGNSRLTTGDVPTATKVPPGAKPPTGTVARDLAVTNEAEIQGVKVLRALKAAGLDESNDPADPRWNNFLVTKLGIAPADLNKGDIQQRTAYVNAALTRTLMSGRPSQYVAELLQQHLPQGTQSGKQLSRVMHDVLEESSGARDQLAHVLGSAAGSLDPTGGETYKQYLQSVIKDGANKRTVTDADVAAALKAAGAANGR